MRCVSPGVRLDILFGVLFLALFVAACGDASDTSGAASTDPGEGTTVPPTPTTVADVPAASFPKGELPEGPSALGDMTNPEFPEPLVDPGEVISGGPPPDGIPPIDNPSFISIDDANQWMTDNEPVVFLEIEGEARAYPVQILIWHEIVNDTVGGVPVTVTYCPLCNSAVSYSRVVNGVTTTFGTSGRLFASALVMYDRATESLWTHFDGRAVVGLLTGMTLEPIPSPLLSWSDFKAAYPDGVVLDREATGHSRPYGENPYVGYDNPGTSPFLFRGDVDERARAKQRVVGVSLDGEARAWTLEAISAEDAKATNSTVDDTPVVIFWKAGQTSALDSAEIGAGNQVGSVGVFSPVVDGRQLTFTTESGVFIDEESGTEWDITGAGVAGELAGTRLEQFHHLDTFWFAWSTYQPGTDLIEG